MRTILIPLLILCSSLLYSQPSPEPGNVYTHCFTDTEWAAFEEEVWAEEQATVAEAVTAAVEPYKIRISSLEGENQKLARTNRVLGVGGLVVAALGIVGWVWAAFK